MNYYSTSNVLQHSASQSVYAAINLKKYTEVNLFHIYENYQIQKYDDNVKAVDEHLKGNVT